MDLTYLKAMIHDGSVFVTPYGNTVCVHVNQRGALSNLFKRFHAHLFETIASSIYSIILWPEIINKMNLPSSTFSRGNSSVLIFDTCTT